MYIKVIPDCPRGAIVVPELRPDLQPQQPSEPRPPGSLSFACGGYHMPYHFGVGQALKAAGLHKREGGVMFLGCSAGALAAVGLALPQCNFDHAKTYVEEVVLPAVQGSWFNVFRLGEYVANCLELVVGVHLPDVSELEGRLHVAVTRLGFPHVKAEVVSSFRSWEHLKAVLQASSAAYPLAPPVEIDGVMYTDGGVTCLLPVLDDSTVTVSSFVGSAADITPSEWVPHHWAIHPPSLEDFRRLYELGFKDGSTWARSNGLLPPEKEPQAVLVERRSRAAADSHWLVACLSVLPPVVVGAVYVELLVRLACHLCVSLIRGRRATEALELMASLLSFSLFLRALPVVGAEVKLQRHRSLHAQSAVYRVMLFAL